MNRDDRLYDICIVGGGFSGLVLAIKLGRVGLNVCIIELNNIVGRRILSTGNGRCNFTNAKLGSEYYHSNHNLDFIEDNHLEFIDFLREIGVFYKDLDGYFYPLTNQAKTVRETLENEVNSLDNVHLLLGNRAKEITFKDEIFTITTVDSIVSSKKAVISCGGLAAATLGSSKFGYKTAAGFGMSVTRLAPALVGLRSNDITLKSLAGVRAIGTVKYREHICHGEIQFNKDGISGYPIMCLSRFVGVDELDNHVSQLSIDMVDYLSRDELFVEIKRRFARNKNQNILNALIGISNEKLVAQAVSLSRIYADTMVSKLDDDDINNLVDNFKSLKLTVIGTKGFDGAQVTAGGVDLKDVNINTLESVKQTGLYFTGEVLDIDGICGGYNITWAYTSACMVSEAIIKDMT